MANCSSILKINLITGHISAGQQIVFWNKAKFSIMTNLEDEDRLHDDCLLCNPHPSLPAELPTTCLTMYTTGDAMYTTGKWQTLWAERDIIVAALKSAGMVRAAGQVIRIQDSRIYSENYTNWRNVWVFVAETRPTKEPVQGEALCNAFHRELRSKWDDRECLSPTPWETNVLIMKRNAWDELRTACMDRERYEDYSFVWPQEDKRPPVSSLLKVMNWLSKLTNWWGKH